jgi:hypothetical protein
MTFAEALHVAARTAGACVAIVVVAFAFAGVVATWRAFED